MENSKQNKMKNTLYDIKKEYLDISNELELSQGELTPELLEKLNINESQLQEKSIGYLSVITAKESFNDTIDNEIKRLQAMKKANDRTITNLKNSLLSAVELFGAFTVGLNKFGIRKSKQTIVSDVNLLPKKYKVTKVVESADKKAIKTDLEAGIEIPNCEIKEINNLKIN